MHADDNASTKLQLIESARSTIAGNIWKVDIFNLRVRGFRFRFIIGVGGVESERVRIPESSRILPRLFTIGLVPDIVLLSGCPSNDTLDLIDILSA
jgi:hypothetical protein